MTRTITRERQCRHPLLGRNVYHDSRSRAFALRPKGALIDSVRHESYIGVMNQGGVGSCTGNAAVACAYRAPFYAPNADWWLYAPDEVGARSWYADNTVVDNFYGTYLPDDTGSSGLAASKVALAAGIISGYQMSPDLATSLEALMDRPGITGLPWYNSMFDAPPSGLLEVDVRSGEAGGHEMCVDEIVAANALGNGTGQLLVGGPNSWGIGWGAQGRWYLRASDWWELRKRQGDVYFWTAKSQPAPAPEPEPVDNRDLALWMATAPYRASIPASAMDQSTIHALAAWGTKKGLI